MHYDKDGFAHMDHASDDLPAAMHNARHLAIQSENRRFLEQLVAGFPELPDDLTEAFDCMRLAVMRHQRDGWHHVSVRDVQRMLAALSELATSSPATSNLDT